MANFFDQFDDGPSPHAAAISSIESGGNYRSVGPTTKTGDRAYGKYQIMGANIGPWGQEILGRNVSHTEFMTDPEIQEKIFKGKFGQYAEKYGPEGAAKAWFAGEKGMNNPNAKDQLGTSVADYARKFTAFAPQESGRVNTVTVKPAAKSNFFDQFDQPDSPAADAPPVPADPRAELAEGLRAGKTNDQEVYRTAAFRTNQGVPKATAGDLAANQFTGGFGDEIMAAATAPIDMAIRGEGYNEAYQHNLAAERDRLDQYRKANPGKALAAEVAGGFGMPVGKAGAVKQAIGTGALYGAGNSEGDLTQRASDAAVGGLASGALGAVVSKVGSALAGKGPATASIDELKAAAKAGYKSDAVKDLIVNPRAVTNAATGIRAKMDAEGFDEIIGTKAHAILKRFETAPAGAVVTGQNLHSIQKTLGKAAGSIDPQEAAAAKMALAEFNDFVENLPAGAVLRGSADDFMRTMREANANYAAAMQSGKIDKKVVLAQDRAAAANSGQNVGNTIRQRMVDVANKPSEQRGLRPEEIQMARDISRGTKTENLIRRADRMLGGGGGMGAMVAGGVIGAGAGAYNSDPTSTLFGAAAPALGIVLRGMGNRMTLNQAHKLSDAIRSRAPLSSATTKYEEKVAQFLEQRNAKTASAAALAARNLATNLRGSGFNVSTGDLMRALQAPATGRADEQQPNVPRPPGQ